MKKTILSIAFLSLIFLASCGGDSEINDNSNTDSSNKTINNNSTRNQDVTSMEIIQEEIKNMPEWVKSEMNIEEPKGIKFVEGISEDRGYQKSAFLIYSGDLETLKKEGKKLAKKAKLKLGKQNPKSKDSISYSNINPKVQGETTDGSKYMKSIIIQKAPDDELDDIEYEYTMGISIMDAGLIKN